MSLRVDVARTGAAIAMLIGLAASALPPPTPGPEPPAQSLSVAQAVAEPASKPGQTTIAQAAPSAAAAPPPSEPAPAPAPVIIVQEAPPPAPPPVNEDEQQALALLADLQRYAIAPADELRRELAAINQAGNPRLRTDGNRIRLAVLLTMPNAGPPDDSRALALLESVSGKTGGASPVKQLALVLYAQIAERMRNVGEERKRSAQAQEKLDQLRAVERSLLLERSRNAGGAGGGGGGGGTGR